MDDLSDSQSRDLFPSSELHNVPQRMLTPFRGYESSPLVTLEEAAIPLISIMPEIQNMISIVKGCCTALEDGLTIDESASIALYTMDWQSNYKSCHFILNATLKASDPILLKPWFLYLKLIMTALPKILSELPPRKLFRGVRSDLSALSCGKYSSVGGFFLMHIICRCAQQ